MSTLFQQLSHLKQKTTVSRIGPDTAIVSILPNPKQTRNLSLQILYTMAIMSYSKLKSHILPSCEDYTKEILSEQNRDINRNRLTKEENNKLSLKIRKFLLYLTPFLNNSDCQKILEYLYRNYKIYVFQAETLITMFMHYWKYPVYHRICQHIQLKSQNFNFTKQISQSNTNPITLSFIIKTILYNNSILQQIVLYTTQYMKLESHTSQDIEIQLQFQEEENQNGKTGMIRNQSKNFLYEIFRYIIANHLHIHYKTITRVCLEAVSKNVNSSQAISMVMLLSTQMLLNDSINHQTLGIIIQKILKKLQVPQVQSIQKNIFNFIVLIWQRNKKSISQTIIENLNQNQKFIEYINHTSCSYFMIFNHLFECYMRGVECFKLLQAMALRIKGQQFVLKYQQTYFDQIFKIYQNNKQNQSINIQSLNKLIHEYMLYELARFYNRHQQLYNIQQAKVIFGNKIATKKGIDITLIPKRLPKSIKKQQNSLKIKKHDVEKNPVEQMESQQQQKEKTKQKITILMHLRKKNIFTKKIDFKDEKICNGIVQLLNEYYQSKMRKLSENQDQEETRFITSEQKNSLFDSTNIFPFYTKDMFQTDIDLQDWTVPIKYIMYHHTKTPLHLIEFVLSQPIHKPRLLSDILFRELVRVASNSLAQQSIGENYKPSISILGKIYHKLVQMLNYQQNIQYLKSINDFCIRLSKNVLSNTGISQGKFYKLIHSHSKILAFIIKNPNYERTYQQIKKTYLQIIDIFGVPNLYLINVGTLQLLTKNDINSKQIKLFITIIIDIVNGYEQKKMQNLKGFNIQELNASVIKCLALCKLMFKDLKSKKNRQKIQEKEKEEDNQEFQKIFSGIAKKMLTSFYGLTKQKHKKSIIKKVLLFLQSLYKEVKFMQTFEKYVQSLKKYPKKVKILMSKYSEIYKMLKSLEFQDEKLKPNIDRLIILVTNIFALEEKLVLFGGLLPDNHIYGIIGEQLSLHVKFNSQQLQEIMKIIPNQITIQWVNFMTQCFKRKHSITSQQFGTILEIKKQNNEQIQQLAKFVCQVSFYSKDTLIPFLKESIEAVKARTQQPDDLSLALITRIISNIGDLIEPYLQGLFKIGIEIQSKFTHQFIQKLVQSLTKPLLIRLVKNTYKQVKNFINFSYFIKKVLSKGVKDTFFKTLLNFYALTLRQSIKQQSEIEQLQKIQGQGFLQMSLTLKEDQLRKVLINFIAWTENTENIDDQLPFGYRKTILLTTYYLLSQSLGSLFTSFYGYIFQTIVKDLTSISVKYRCEEKVKNNKRSKQSSDLECNLSAYYMKQILQSLESLFNNDTEHDFLDSGKFDELSEPLTDIFLITNIGNQYKNIMENYLIPCLLSLCYYVQDDYQLKTLCYKILLHLKNKNGQIQESIYTFLLKLIEKIQDRSLIIVSDLGRFLGESLKSRNEKVQELVRSIMYKIKDLSGEDIQNYVK